MRNHLLVNTLTDGLIEGAYVVGLAQGDHPLIIRRGFCCRLVMDKNRMKFKLIGDTASNLFS